MKVLTAIVAALCLVAAQSACHDLCSGGAFSCQTKSEAQNCQKGFGLSSNNKCIKCGNPLTFLGKGTANKGVAAGKGQWWEPWNSGTCKTCVTGCETCSDGSTCSACAAGYWPVATSTTTCASCGSNCVTCASATTCTKCKTGFYAKAGACTACTGNCNTCDGAGPKCDSGKCKLKYKRAADGNCVSCDQTKPGFWWDATTTGSCTSCQSNCLTCQDKTKCQTCVSGSTIKKTQGYYVSAGACKSCNTNCAACTGTASCTVGKCHAGFQRKTDGTCVGCSTVGYKFTAGTGTCKQCDVNCKTCATDTACTAGQCKEGYVLGTAAPDTGKCVKCAVAGCATCAYLTRATVCTACALSYFRGTTAPAAITSCKQCDANCLVAGQGCLDTVKCKTPGCTSKYQRAQNGKCVSCDLFTTQNTKVWVATEGLTCVSCMGGCSGATFCGVDANNKAECQKCNVDRWPLKKDGTTAGVAQTTKPPADGSCAVCQANCASCSGKTTCNGCVNGFRLKGTVCEQCTQPNCNKCATVANQCTACKTGFQRAANHNCVQCAVGSAGVFWSNVGTGTCTPSCQANCAVCTDATKCATCVKAAGGTKQGYVLQVAKTCKSCPSNCGQCDADVTGAKCDTNGCNAGFSRDNKGVCHACTGAGKWFDPADGSCTACKANCASCSSKTACNLCASGYYKDSSGNCGKCSVTNCAACAAGTHTTLCSACFGKYAISTDKKSCSSQCDAHATGCTDANNAASCDTAKKYFKSGGNRCVYCNVDLTKQTANTNKGTLFWDAANGRCWTCDPNADGCASGTTVRACKKGYVKNGNYCTTACSATQTAVSNFAKGKCYTCDGNAFKSSCTSPWSTNQCNKGYHVQSAGVGKCCGDDSGAPAALSGVAALASLVAATAALLH